MEFKHLTIGDLHLYDREMRTTKRMVENSRVILDELYKYLKENEDIILLNINGDIQHKTPTNVYNRKEVAHWRRMFTKIGQLMQQRFKKFKGYNLVGVTDKVRDKFKKGEIYPIFTTKGNHDYDKDSIHTFYDDLIDEGLIVRAEGLLVAVDKKRTFFSYRDYGVETREVPEFKTATDVIALEHNDVLHEESLLWQVPKAEEKFLKAEEVVEGTDVTILHHIHEKVDPIYIGNKKDKVLWQVGSIGRTAYQDESKRDVGYGALMKFGNTTEFATVEFDLIPYREYFSYKKIERKQAREHDFKDFMLKIDDYEISKVSYEEDIDNFEGVEDEVKRYAKGIMKMIEDRGEE